jgi:hypothetical protein
MISTLFSTRWAIGWGIRDKGRRLAGGSLKVWQMGHIIVRLFGGIIDVSGKPAGNSQALSYIDESQGREDEQDGVDG